MFSSISSYLFGSYSEESSDSLAETVVSSDQANSDDWVLIDPKKQVTSGLTISSGQPLVGVDDPSNQDVTQNKPKDDPVDGEDKENDSSDDASSISSLSESSANDFDSEGEPLEYLVPKPAKKVKKPRKPRIIIDDQHGINAGLMDGSWFVTPPPCFIRHKKSKKHQIPSSPLEDMLIEHPSISVYQASTSTDSSKETSKNASFDYLIESAFDYFPMIKAISKNITWPDWHGPTKIKIPAACFIYKPVPSAQRQSPKKRNCSKKSQQNGHNSNINSNNSNIFNLRPEVNQPQASREFRAINTNNNHHDRNEYLQEINNLQYNLAPMQKAMNQGSQKFLKKSFLNRQNLVKFRSERQRFTQKPKCHSLKMC